MIARRTFIKRASMLAVAASASPLYVRDSVAQQVPNSSGTEPASIRDARLEEFRRLPRQIGTTRNIVVTPSAYVTDNRVTLDAIAKLGPNARGVAVIHPSVTDTELKALAGGGVRGIRFSITDPATAATSVDMI